MVHSHSKLGMKSIAELQRELDTCTDYIKQLENELQQKEQRIQALVSELDKYQSVFTSNEPKTRHRGIGISAEPNKIAQDQIKRVPKTQS
ncbi:hypothetical protein Ciccas_011190 [Cichlidogyrus casuarinus]|uniref:Bcr-Abl oncoprotein oligomerisation domain-containing protein n=1 Tax=Cichlidogyrus casuarinus TaxID=1844966 RepID=A0ABD2PRZ5_9PLAT